MSPRAASRLDSLGFTKVFDYVTGRADWTANGLPTEGRRAEVPSAGDTARRDVPTCRPTERLGDVRERVQAAGQKVCIVTSEGGVVLGRLRGEAFDADPEASVESVMESGPTTIRPDLLLEEITEHMQEQRVGSILVTTSEGRLIGILYRKDAEQRLG
jgi:CBS domain-containing protein